MPPNLAQERLLRMETNLTATLQSQRKTPGRYTYLSVFPCSWTEMHAACDLKNIQELFTNTYLYT